MNSFYMIVCSLITFMSGYAYLRMVSRLAIFQIGAEAFPWVPAFTMVLFFFFALGPFLYFKFSRSSKPRNRLALAGAYLTALLILFFFLAVGYDLLRLFLWIVGNLTTLSPKTLQAVEIVWLAVSSWYIAASLVLGVAKPRLERVSLRISGFPFRDFKIAMFTDMHIGPFLKRDFVDSCVRRVNDLGPDLVVIVGDIADAAPEKLPAELEPLQQLRSTHGTYFALGNHEYYAGVGKILDVVTKLGVSELINETARIGDRTRFFNLVSLSDPTGAGMRFHPPDFEKAVAKRDPSSPSVLLAHQPSLIKLIDDKIDLVLSGHTHGGQVFPFGLLVRLAQPFVAGLHRVNEFTRIYVSRGTGFWGPPIRFPWRAEITLLTLGPDESDQPAA